MPEPPHPKLNRPILAGSARAPARALHGYAELEATSNYTFLTGGSHPEELVQQAAGLGHAAIAITDTNTLAGIIRAHVAAKDVGIQYIVGCRLLLRSCANASGSPTCEVLVYPSDRAAYGRLCKLLTLGKRRAPKGECWLMLDDLAAHHAGLLAIAVPPADLRALTIDHSYERTLASLTAIFDDDRLSLAMHRPFDPYDEARLEALARLSADSGVPLVATGAVLYHAPERRPLQDVLTCIRLGTTIDRAGYSLQANAERHLKPPGEMARLFACAPRALARSVAIAERARGFSLDQLKYQYPREVTPPGTTAIEHLRTLAELGARERYPAGVPTKTRHAIEHELSLIEELNYAEYFLTVHDLVTFARSRGILCQGRGAAANSAVCFVLGVTAVDPDRASLLFERFISRERNEPPDIDIDFEHERREEVIQYIYAKYGRDRAALTAEVISYRGRSAVRDVGKAMGLSLDCVDQLAKTLDWWDGGTVEPARLRELGLNPDDRTLRLVLHLSRLILGFPRHLSQHVGGFVITDTRLSELVPIENAAMDDRTVIEWDKDDIDAMGMLKVDCLGLGMLTCIRKGLDLINRHHASELAGPLTFATIPAEDPAVYDMICKADTIGVFQIESRAQMAMLPRLRPRTFYDLVIEVAIVRPGPIQGKMVHPYLRRRRGEEPVEYPSEAVREVLDRTLGVPLFQEQAMKLAIVAGGFTPGEADQLRRAMAAWKRKGDAIARFGEKLIAGMRAKGYDADFAVRCFEQIKGFSEYGFPESHAASFALLVYASAWQKCHYPAAFSAALINSQPMGFYQPAQIIRDAQEHGVQVRPIDVNASEWDCTLEADGVRGSDDAFRGTPLRKCPPAIRLGLRLVKGLSQSDADAMATARTHADPYRTIEECWRRSGVSVAALRCLARADAFGSLGLDRQRALWMIQRLSDDPLPMFDALADPKCKPSATAHPADWKATPQCHDSPQESEVDAITLPRIAPVARVGHDYAATGLSLKAHPLAFLRSELHARGVTPNRAIQDEARFPHGTKVRVAGLVLVRQRPATASGVLFMTIEDETAIANLVVWPRTFDRFRSIARHASTIVVHGHIERSGAVVHVIAKRFERVTAREHAEAAMVRSRDFH